jgi:hypothetical protein
VNDDRTIKTTWQLVTESRDAVRQTRDMISAVDALAEREKRLTEAANKRVDARREAMEVDERARKIAPELYERELSAEDRYQKKLRERIDMLRENTRLQEDLRRVQVRSIGEMVAALDSASRDTLAVSRREQLAKVSAFAQYGIGAGDVLGGDTRGKALEAAGYSRRDNGPSADRAKNLYSEYSEQKPGAMQQWWTEGRMQQFAKFALGATVAEKAITGLAHAITLFNNETISTTAKMVGGYRSLVNEIPIIGGLHRAGEALGDAMFFGSQRRAMNRQQEIYETGKPIGELQYRRAFAEMSADRNIAATQFSPQIAASVASGLNAPMLAAQSFGIGGAGYRMIDQRMSGPSQEIIQLRGDLEKNKVRELGLQADKYKLQTQYDKIEQSIRRLEQERDRQKFTDFQTLQYSYQIRALQDKRSAIGGELYGLEQQIGSTRKEGVGLRGSIREQQNQRLLGELDVTRERVESRIDARQQFSGMGPADQMAIAMAVNQAKTRGYETLTEEQRDLLKSTSITSRFARDQERDWSARNPNLASIEKQIFPQGEDTDSLMQKQRKLEQDLAKEKQSALEEAAKDAAKEEIASIRGVFAALVDQFVNQIAKIREELGAMHAHQRIQ